MAWIPPLAQELPYAVGVAKKKKKKDNFHDTITRYLGPGLLKLCVSNEG